MDALFLKNSIFHFTLAAERLEGRGPCRNDLDVRAALSPHVTGLRKGRT